MGRLGYVKTWLDHNILWLNLKNPSAYVSLLILKKTILCELRHYLGAMIDSNLRGMGILVSFCSSLLMSFELKVIFKIINLVSIEEVIKCYEIYGLTKRGLTIILSDYLNIY